MGAWSESTRRSIGSALAGLVVAALVLNGSTLWASAAEGIPAPVPGVSVQVAAPEVSESESPGPPVESAAPEVSESESPGPPVESAAPEVSESDGPGPPVESAAPEELPVPTGSTSGTLEVAGQDPIVESADEGPGSSAPLVDATIRNQHVLSLEKRWVNGFAGDTSQLRIEVGLTSWSASTSRSSGSAGSELDEANEAIAKVFAGATVSITEVLGAGNRGSYRTTWQCLLDQGITASGTGTGGSFTMPDEPVICVITNERTMHEVWVGKDWMLGGLRDTATLRITGGLVDPAESTSTSTGFWGWQNDQDNHAVTEVFSGATVNVSEVLGAGNKGTYAQLWRCWGLGYDFEHRTGFSFTMPDERVVCYVTNYRIWPSVVVQKAWVNARRGDTAELTIRGPLLSGNDGDALDAAGSNSGISLASGALGTVVDTPRSGTGKTNFAYARVTWGDTVTVSEHLGAGTEHPAHSPAGNAGEYSSSLACTSGDGITIDVDADGSFTMPTRWYGEKTPRMRVTCTFTNERILVAPTRPTAAAESCAPDGSATTLPGSIAIPANPDYEYLIDGTPYPVGDYPFPAGSYAVSAHLVATAAGGFPYLPSEQPVQEVRLGTVAVDPSPVCAGLKKSAGPPSGETVAMGDLVTYSITGRNGGHAPVVGETLVDTLPHGVEVIESTIDPSSGGYDPAARTITWTFDLAEAVDGTPASADFTYAVKVTAEGGEVQNSVAWVERNLTGTTGHPVENAPAEAVETEQPTPELQVGGAQAGPPTVESPENSLADSGASHALNVAAAGLLAVLVGGLMVGAGRRRRLGGVG